MNAKKIPHYKNSHVSKDEPIYLNLFEAIFVDDTISLAMDNVCSIKCNTNKSFIKIKFADDFLFYTESEDSKTGKKPNLFVLPELEKMYRDKKKIKKLMVSYYDKRGDIYLQYEFEDLLIIKITNDIELDYAKQPQHGSIFSNVKFRFTSYTQTLS